QAPVAGRYGSGGRPQDGAEKPLVPGARLQEPVRGGRRTVRVAGGQEPDLDDPRAVDADERVHRGSDEEGGALMGGGRLSSQGPADPERGLPGGSGAVVVELAPRVGRSRGG